MGLSSARAFAKASSPQGYQSTFIQWPYQYIRTANRFKWDDHEGYLKTVEEVIRPKAFGSWQTTYLFILTHSSVCDLITKKTIQILSQWLPGRLENLTQCKHESRKEGDISTTSLWHALWCGELSPWGTYIGEKYSAQSSKELQTLKTIGKPISKRERMNLTGLWACWRRYGLCSLARRLVYLCDEPPPSPASPPPISACTVKLPLKFLFVNKTPNVVKGTPVGIFGKCKVPATRLPSTSANDALVV